MVAHWAIVCTSNNRVITDTKPGSKPSAAQVVHWSPLCPSFHCPPVLQNQNANTQHTQTAEIDIILRGEVDLTL